MISTAQLNELTRFNNAAVAGIPGELRSLRSSLRNASPEATRDALLEVAPAIADRHGRVVAAGSAEWYEQVRRSQVGGTFMARPGALPDPDVIRSNVRYVAGALFVEHRVSPFDSLAGSLTRHVMDVSRETIKTNVNRDARAAGWQRNARPDGCDFCVMLSSRVTERGGVYKRSTANFASHDNCRCTSSPSWDKDAPDMPVEAYRASESLVSLQNRASNPNLHARDRAKAQDQLDRHRARTRSWIESNRWVLDDIRASS